MIVAPIDQGKVHLVQQYRYPVGGRHWEFPQGSWEEQSKVGARTIAAGELEEETGLRAGRFIHAGCLYPLYGTTNQNYDLFLATNLSEGRLNREIEEQDMVTSAFSLKQFEQMIVDGEIRDAGTVASFGLLRLKGLV